MFNELSLLGDILGLFLSHVELLLEVRDALTEGFAFFALVAVLGGQALYLIFFGLHLLFEGRYLVFELLIFEVEALLVSLILLNDLLSKFNFGFKSANLVQISVHIRR